MKNCSRCKQLKEYSEFHKCKTHSDGLQYKCKNCTTKYDSERRKKNPNRYKEGVKIWHAANRQNINASIQKWKDGNRGKTNAVEAKRRATKLLATPSWLTKEHLKQIEEFYIEAARLTKETGIPHDVDHIDPLQGKNVCGLHVPWNLQILTASENRKKGNKIID